MLAAIVDRNIIRVFSDVPYCPAVTPPLFVTYFQEKEGGGRNNEDLCFRLTVKPPPPPTNSRTEIIEALLCGTRGELLPSTCRGSTERWKNCWSRTCCHFCKVYSLAARLLPPAV